MTEPPEVSPPHIPKLVIWMAVLLPYASATMLTLAGTLALVAILGLGQHLLPKQTADQILVVLFAGFVVVIVALLTMYWTVLTYLKRIRKHAGTDQDGGLGPLATWWKSAGLPSRISGALGVAVLLLGVGLVRSSESFVVGWSAVILGGLLLLATRFLGSRRGVRK